MGVEDKTKQRLNTVKNAIRDAIITHQRPENSVNLVAVSKTQPSNSIEFALEAGHRRFGENRVQEAQKKWPALKQKYPGTQLHLIGPLQTNKVASAVALFDVIETIDRFKLAKSVARHMADVGRKIDCYVQVNTGAEPQKAGVVPEEADELIRKCKTELSLPIAGLMCIPPADEEPSLHFALLSKIAERNKLEELSMGMSADFEVAIQFGASFVRVGTAIFGERRKYR